jgi:hypothetical protein
MGLIRKSALLTGAAAALVLAGAGMASADSNASGAAYGSPGVLSGNVVQVPIDVPVNACGNSVGLLGLLSPAYGNDCSNEQDSGYHHHSGYGGTGYSDGWHAVTWNHTGWNNFGWNS